MPAPQDVQDRVTRGQRFLSDLRSYHGWLGVVPILRQHYRWIARWWELEAMRGYESSDRSREYAANYRWLVEVMDAGRRVTADSRGVYVDGELASKVQEKARHTERREKQSSRGATP